MPNLRKKNAKAVRKSKNKGVKLTKSYYEDALVEANRQLADISEKIIPVENEKVLKEKELEEICQNYNDIKKSLAYKIKAAQEELNFFSGKVQRLTEIRDNQRRVFDKESNVQKEKFEKVKKAEDDKKYNLATSMTILGNVETQRNDYKEKELELSLREAKQKEQHATELYELDKKIRIECTPLWTEMNKQLDELCEPFTKLDMKEKAKRARSENNQLAEKMETLGVEFLKLCHKLDDLVDKKFKVQLSLEMATERLSMAKKRLRVQKEKARKLVKKEEEKNVAPDMENVEITSSEGDSVIEIEHEDDQKTNRPKDEGEQLKELLETVEDIAREALLVQDWNLRPRDSQISITEEQIEDEKEEIFAKVTNLIDLMATKIEEYFSTMHWRLKQKYRG